MIATMEQAVRYQVQRLLGEGGMGKVYLAEDLDLHRQVALKFLNSLQDVDSRNYFREEVKLLSRLSHPNLIKIYDYHEESSELCAWDQVASSEKIQGPCFAMEFLQGQPMEQATRDYPPARLMESFVDLTQGLHYLHNRNILHRDLKPSNVVSTEASAIKILDFGLSTVGTEGGGLNTLGTLAYMPPEAFWGDYTAQSDLFSLGVLFYEILSGRLPYFKPLSRKEAAPPAPEALEKIRPDLPGYFCDLMHRLLELNPARRPHSALSLLRFLNQHVETPFPIVEETGSETILEKVPLVGRDSALEELSSLAQASRQGRTAAWAIISGPTGVGRSRLLEEFKWKCQLEGLTYYAFGASQSGTWLASFSAKLKAPDSQDLFALSKALCHYAAQEVLVLACCDLQDWSEAALARLRTLLNLSLKTAAKLLLIMEYSDDWIPSSLQELVAELKLQYSPRIISLGDLGPADSRSLIQKASVDAPLPEAVREEIAVNSGGRPLLIFESLRQVLAEEPGKIAATDQRIPKNLQEVSARRIHSLSEAGKSLLALIAVHPEPAPLQDVQKMWEVDRQAMEEPLLELDRKGFLAMRSAHRSELALAHLSLRRAYLQALPPEVNLMAHRQWLECLTLKGEPKPGPLAIWVSAHARLAGDKPTFKKWGYAAAETFQTQGQEPQAIDCYLHLLRMAETALERSMLNAHLAPLYYRLGRFEEALLAYDRWFADRVDDETFLQKVKHRFYTGLVYFSWGKPQEARRRLEDAFKIGDSRKFPSHRPYHVRGFNLLAALEEKERNFIAARRHLQEALSFAEGMPLQLGEIEQRLGKVEQLEQNYDAAFQHYERSLQHYRLSGNVQAIAIAQNSIGMLQLERGVYGSALASMEEAVSLAKQSGELLQWARYKENLGLAALELAQYGQALEEMEDARDLIEALGKEEDKLLLRMHRVGLYLQLGNLDKAAHFWRQLAAQRDQLSELGFGEYFLVLEGEYAYQTHHYGRAHDFFHAALRRAKGKAGFNTSLAWIGLCRSQLRVGGLSPVPDFLPEALRHLRRLRTPFYELWSQTIEFLSHPPHDLRESELIQLLNLIKVCEKADLRLELYSLLSQDFRRRGLQNLTARLALAAETEFQKILQTLPEELKMDFEKNRDLKSLDQTLGDLLPAPAPEPAPGLGPAAQEKPTTPQISEARFRQYSEINRQITQKTDLNEILERVMDAAIELTGAERGFLVLKSDSAKQGLIEGFEVRTARHLNQGSLQEEEFKFSMTAIKQAVSQGTYLLTDNAQLDPRFQEKKSVVQFQLKSILAVPLELEGKILGAIYLDHRYQPGCFTDMDVTLLTAFASQATLAIQKAQMMEELRKAKERLEVEVQDQARHIEVLSGELAQVRDQLRYEYTEIVGQSQGMMQVFQLLDHVTETTIPVWIWGESGTGKELIARSLHFNSPRKGGPFVSENCSSIPETLLESELFGHKKGAFTHADRDRIGLFEQATGGTLFLDEIADMSLAMQAKMLRVLQEGEIRPVGSSKKIKIDVRLVTASNRDLNQMVKDDKFRQDLFFRLNGMTIRLPPLRERKDDIPMLVDHMIKKIARDFKLQPSEVSDEAFQVMFRYAWPGNIRELEGVMRNALLFAKGRTITPDFLSLNPSLSKGGLEALSGKGGEGAKREEQSEERQLILEALKRHEMDKEKVAEELGISLRSLYTRLERLGIPKKKTVLAKYLGLKA